MLRISSWNLNTTFVTPVRSCVVPSYVTFFFQMSFGRVSICFGCIVAHISRTFFFLQLGQHVSVGA